AEARVETLRVAIEGDDEGARRLGAADAAAGAQRTRRKERDYAADLVDSLQSALVRSSSEAWKWRGGGVNATGSWASSNLLSPLPLRPADACGHVPAPREPRAERRVLALGFRRLLPVAGRCARHLVPGQGLLGPRLPVVRLSRADRARPADQGRHRRRGR